MATRGTALVPEGFPYLPEEDGSDVKLQKGVSVLPDFAHKPEGMRRFDIRNFLKESGVELPAGGSAIYYEQGNGLVVVGPISAIGIVEQLVRPIVPLDYYPSPTLRTEATIVEFRVSASIAVRDLPVARLRETAGK